MMMDYLTWIISGGLVAGYMVLALAVFFGLDNSWMVEDIVLRVGAFRRHNNARWKFLASLTALSVINLSLVGFGMSPFAYEKLSDITTSQAMKYRLDNRKPIFDNPVRHEALDTVFSVLSSGKFDEAMASQDTQDQIMADQAAAAAFEKEVSDYAKAHAPHYPSWFHFWLSVILTLATIVYFFIAFREEFLDSILEVKKNLSGGTSSGGSKDPGAAAAATPRRRGLLGFIMSVISIDMIMEVLLTFLGKVVRTMPIGKSA
jgi:hypothetical protein